MTVISDSRGVPQLAEPSDLAAVEEAIRQFVAMKLDYERCGRGAHSPAPVPLRLMLAIDLLCSMERAVVSEAALICADIAATAPAETRTRAMLSAIESWADGDLVGARNGFHTVVEAYPGDAVSVFTVHMLDFYIGDAPHMLASMADAIDSFAADDPVTGHLHGLYAFSLEENGLFEAAIDHCRTALAHHADDVYAMHAMVHCLYETGRHDEGARYIEEYMRNRDSSTPMRIHIWWHYALFELYAENVREVLACYRISIRRKSALRSAEDLDAVTLLWRLALVKPSLDLSAYWRSLYQDWEPYLQDNWYPFNDFHAYIVYCQVGEYDRADALLEAVRARGKVVPDEIFDIFLGFRSFTTGEYADAASRLAATFDRAAPMGGSNAQRDVIELTAFEAALRSRNHELAEQIRDSGRIFRHDGPVLQNYRDRLAALRTSDHHVQEISS